MYQLLVIISLIVSVLLVMIVLVQNPKGGGLTSGFSSSSQLMGVQRTGDFLEKGTWGLAIFLMVLSMAINIAVKGGTSGTETSSDRQKLIENASKAHGTAPAPVSQSPIAPATGSTQSQPLPAAPVKK